MSPRPDGWPSEDSGRLPVLDQQNQPVHEGIVVTFNERVVEGRRESRVVGSNGVEQSRLSRRLPFLGPLRIPNLFD